jgi:hypothetical protein
MTDERDKSSGAKESSARNTARDVPFVRGAGSESEPAPHGQRPAQLPRDPTYEAELAQVELAVLRDRERRDDPSTKQGGGRGHQYLPGQPPESVTPESPQARGPEVAHGRSPEPPSSGGHAVASGTLLSVGAVDPRGKTERTLETPRMFISQPQESGEAYFRPGKIPSVTVHQTLETETVKLSDSIDPRRAKTIPRLDRAELARLAAVDGAPESEAPVAMSRPDDSLELPDSNESARWNQQEYDPESSLGPRDGQIHASLSRFRDQAEPSFSMDGVPTRPEPLAARRASEPPETPAVPDTSTIPTQRDLPMHRIEASRPPPPPPRGVLESSPTSASGEHSESEGPRPMTASIAVEEPQTRPIWVNLAAFVAALFLALVLGWLVTSAPQSKQAAPDSSAAALRVAVPVKPAEPAPARVVVEPAPNTAPAPGAKSDEAAVAIAPSPAARAAPKPVAATPQKSPAPAIAPGAAPPGATPPGAMPPGAAAPGATPHKSASSPKSSHETIF